MNIDGRIVNMEVVMAKVEIGPGSAPSYDDGSKVNPREGSTIPLTQRNFTKISKDQLEGIAKNTLGNVENKESSQKTTFLASENPPPSSSLPESINPLNQNKD